MEFKEKIFHLVTLQEKDSRLYGIRAKAQEIPGRIEDEKSYFEKIKQETEEKKKNLVKLQLSKKEKELELETKEGLIKKHSAELNAIKSNDSYRALLSEIDNDKKEKNNIENQILDIMEDIEKENAVIKENERILKEKEAESSRKIAAMQEELNKLEGELSGLEADREAYAKQVPAELLSKYDYIRESRDGLAVVPVEGENCGGCHIVLRPQLINDVRKNMDIVICDSCSRILYRK